MTLHHNSILDCILKVAGTATALGILIGVIGIAVF